MEKTIGRIIGTAVVCYVEDKKYSNNNGFLLINN